MEDASSHLAFNERTIAMLMLTAAPSKTSVRSRVVSK
jgi:hypothetical protein